MSVPRGLSASQYAATDEQHVVDQPSGRRADDVPDSAVDVRDLVLGIDDERLEIRSTVIGPAGTRGAGAIWAAAVNGRAANAIVRTRTGAFIGDSPEQG
jgi:hypothetical protein